MQAGQTQASHTQLDEPRINTIRTLLMDTVQQANSSHPGTPMTMAPVADCVGAIYRLQRSSVGMHTFSSAL
ncbi:hypothetical protein H6F94_05970 [Leptolyngbya sp. FACHB-261]|nr:hypothetical protein [Leptolyngbya sp. FACHB-261]